MKQHTLTSFDKFCLDMVIEGAWVFRELPSFEQLQTSLISLISLYPQLEGYYIKEKDVVEYDETMAVSPDFLITEKNDLCVSDICNSDIYEIAGAFDIKGFKSGKIKPFKARLIKLSDGIVLVVQCAHLLMDGHSLYSFMRQWSQICNGKSIVPDIVDQNCIPQGTQLSKEDTIRIVHDAGWPKISFVKVITMIVNTIRQTTIKDTSIFPIDMEELFRVKSEAGVSTNSVLCAMAAKKLEKVLPSLADFKLIVNADLRSRVRSIDPRFFGNAAQPLVPKATFDISEDPVELSLLIDAEVRDIITSDTIEKTLLLSQASSHYKLPYFFFDASKFNCPAPKAIYVNNFLKFRAEEIEFGTGFPVHVEPNRLQDMVKFWRYSKDGAINIIFAGFSAKAFNKTKEKQ